MRDYADALRTVSPDQKGNAVFKKKTAQARYARVRTFLEHGLFCDWDALFLRKSRLGFLVEVDWNHVLCRWNAEHPEDPIENVESFERLCRRACQDDWGSLTAYWRIVSCVTPSAIHCDPLARIAKLYGRPLQAVNGLPSYRGFERKTVFDERSLRPRVQSKRSRQERWIVCEPREHFRTKLLISANNPCIQMFRHIRSAEAAQDESQAAR